MHRTSTEQYKIKIKCSLKDCILQRVVYTITEALLSITKAPPDTAMTNNHNRVILYANHYV